MITFRPTPIDEYLRIERETQAHRIRHYQNAATGAELLAAILAIHKICKESQWQSSYLREIQQITTGMILKHGGA